MSATIEPLCVWCEEPVAANQQHPAFREPMHGECGFRSAVGSVAHGLRICSCYLPHSKLGDPPGLTKREAARAAQDLWVQTTKWFGQDWPESIAK